jgi:cation:H+ antiporter
MMFSGISLFWLIVIFAVAALITWAAGIWLSDTTDILASRFGLGQALGGLILLAISTNLPEIVITVTAAVQHHLGIAVGNLIGGIALQTVVLAALDLSLKGQRPLSYRAASLSLVLEAALVVGILNIAVLGTRLSPSLVFLRVTPQNVLIALAWVGGLWMLKKAQNGLAWQAKGNAPDSQEKPAGHSQKQKDQNSQQDGASTAKVVTKFLIASFATLAAGFALEESGDQIARHWGMSGVIFGATVLAASTSLPELSTGITSVRMGDYQLAMSDIFGGNAFLPVLFLMASLLSGESVLPHAQNTDVYLAGLGVLLTAVYILGLILRPHRRYAGMGWDSWLVVGFYVIGVIGLAFVPDHV